jgi:hypothetical protein
VSSYREVFEQEQTELTESFLKNSVSSVASCEELASADGQIFGEESDRQRKMGRLFLAVARSVNVEQLANHLLVLGAVFFRFLSEKVHTGFAQRNSHFDAFLLQYELLGRG